MKDVHRRVALGAAGRLAAALVLAPCLARARAATTEDHAHAGGSAHDGDRDRLITEGDAALRQGRAADALELFEKAALVQHAADAELGIVRAQMALGHYRRALAFCAHTAAAHRDEPGGLALYAWLLHAGGQRAFAQRLLDEALARPTTARALLARTRVALQTPCPIADDVLRERPSWLAPEAWTASGAHPSIQRARVVSTGLLLTDGATAVVPRAPLEGAETIWVRNGLGQTANAAPSRMSSPDPDLALLNLDVTLPAPTWKRAHRDPFAGSPGAAFTYALDPQGRASWPLTWQGFFAGVPGATTRPLGLDAPTGSRGGPVLDAAGRLVGLVIEPLRQEDGRQLIGLQRLLSGCGERLPTTDVASAPPLLGLDAQYEAALRGSLQVLVAA